MTLCVICHVEYGIWHQVIGHKAGCCRKFACRGCYNRWNSKFKRELIKRCYSCNKSKIRRTIAFTRMIEEELCNIANEGKIRQCPRCGNGIERTAGCNLMTCRCGTKFCYGCGSTGNHDRGSCNKKWIVVRERNPRGVGVHYRLIYI